MNKICGQTAAARYAALEALKRRRRCGSRLASFAVWCRCGEPPCGAP